MASLTSPPRSVERTAAFDVTVRIRNAGANNARASATAFYLSAARRLARRAIRLQPRQAVVKLKRHAAASATIALIVPRSARLGRYYLITCADAARKVAERNEANNCRSSSRRVKVLKAFRPPAGKTSTELIDAAVRARRISAEIGTLYKVFAQHKDPRLPPEYRGGAGGEFDDSSLMTDVGAHLGTFSRAVQAKLKPFFIAPYYSASWWAIQHGKASSTPGGRARSAAGGSPRCGGILTDWDHLDTTDGNFRIWWQHGVTADARRAAVMGSDLKGTIFPALAGLMTPGASKPLSDGGSSRTGICRGGSDALDVALTDVDHAETLTDSLTGCSQTSSHINIERAGATTATPTNRDTLAHELMHAFQYTFQTGGGCDEYQWLREATAQWAMDFVYPGDNAERGAPGNPTKAIDAFFRDPGVSLEFRDGVHEYGAYLYFLFLSKTLGPDKIRAVWAAAAANSDSLKAVDDVAHFKDVWPTFALNNWNRAPFDFYNMWDAPFAQGPKRSDLLGVPDDTTINAVLDGNGNAILRPDVRIDHLATRYFDFDLSSSAVRSLAFDSLLVDPGHIQALVRIGGAWHDAGDWSSPSPPKFFCRDFASERVDELVLIASNNSYDRSSVLDPGSPPPTLVGTDVGCRTWVGSFSATAHKSAGGDDRTETWSGNATFERPEGANPPGVLPAQSASITWSLSETVQGGCTFTAGPAVLTNGSGSVDIPGANSAQDPRAYHIFVSGTDSVPAHAECPGPTSFDYMEHPYSIWLETAGSGAGERHTVKPGGGTGDDTSGWTDAAGTTVDWHWNFSAP